jgi:hypothetical protein
MNVIDVLDYITANSNDLVRLHPLGRDASLLSMKQIMHYYHIFALQREKAVKSDGPVPFARCCADALEPVLQAPASHGISSAHLRPDKAYLLQVGRVAAHNLCVAI